MNSHTDESDSGKSIGRLMFCQHAGTAVVFLCLVLMALAAWMTPKIHASTSTSPPELSIAVNGEEFRTSVPIKTVNGRVMITIEDIEFLADGRGVFHSGSGAYRFVSSDVQLLLIESRVQARKNGTMHEQPVAPVVQDDTLLVSVRFAADVFGWDIEWDSDNRTVLLQNVEVSGDELSSHNAQVPQNAENSEPEISRADLRIYDPTEDEMDLFAQLISAEAPDEPFEGKVAVGAVVINRIKSSHFPNTIRDVILQEGQFCPANSGEVFETSIRPQAKEAAEEALMGADPTGGALYFFNLNLITNPTTLNWAQSLPVFANIGRHTFAGRRD